MAINNSYCNVKVQKELKNIKNRDFEMHNNPDNLSYYFFKDNFSGLDFQVIKKLPVESAFGKIELAIIGSSHYLKLNNCFTEIITCSENKAQKEHLIFSGKGNKNFSYSYKFKKFIYETSLDIIDYYEKEDFYQYEKNLLKRKDIFAHAFEKQSAITALHYQNTDLLFKLQSWHTYPVYQKIIITESLLIRV